MLIKYLEDRGVFPGPGWFGRFRKGARSFFDVLKGGEPDEVSALLEALEKKFNGDVFTLHDGLRLTKTALRSFAPPGRGEDPRRAGATCGICTRLPIFPWRSLATYTSGSFQGARRYTLPRSWRRCCSTTRCRMLN